MATPMLLIVSADPETQRELPAALERRFGRDYRVVVAGSSAEALDALAGAHADATPVALAIADHRLQEIDGIILLARVHAAEPGALRVLSIAMGDEPEAVHRAMALGQIDLFIVKPAWRWAEEWLYPQIQEALTAWTRIHGPRLEMVQVVGERWSARGHELRDLLTRNIVPFGFHDVDSPEGQALLSRHRLDPARLPAVILFNGTVLSDPDNVEVATALGVRTRPDAETYDVAIIGAGPAGLAAAVYGASEGLRTIVVEREAIGGQAGTSSMIRNYLGFPRGVSGGELTSRAYEQALGFGVTFIFASEVTGGTWGGLRHTLALADGGTLSTRAVVIATGVTYRRLGVPSLESLVGAGVFYGAALAEAPALRGQAVAIVGAGNSAGQAALHLAKFASRVTLLVRGADLESSMSDYLIREIERAPNIAVRLTTQVADGWGTHRLEGVVLEDTRTGASEELPMTALFIMIGAVPWTEWVGPEVQRDAGGYLLTGRDLGGRGRVGTRPPLPLETSVPGVFAVGDVRANSTKRVASAVGEGSVAIRLVHEYLASRHEPTPTE